MKSKKWISSVVALFVLFAGVLLFIKSPSPATINLPNPNGYDDLVAAGQMFVGELPDCYGAQMDEECFGKIRAF